MSRATSSVNLFIKKLKDTHSKYVARDSKGILDAAIARLKSTTPVDTGNARDGWMLDEKGKAIVNSVEYISDLNDGASDQAPSHFVEAALLADPNIKPGGIIVTLK